MVYQIWISSNKDIVEVMAGDNRYAQLTEKTQPLCLKLLQVRRYLNKSIWYLTFGLFPGCLVLNDEYVDCCFLKLRLLKSLHS